MLATGARRPSRGIKCRCRYHSLPATRMAPYLFLYLRRRYTVMFNTCCPDSASSGRYWPATSLRHDYMLHSRGLSLSLAPDLIHYATFAVRLFDHNLNGFVEHGCLKSRVMLPRYSRTFRCFRRDYRDDRGSVLYWLVIRVDDGMTEDLTRRRRGVMLDGK